jgi:hypothetical protein
MMDDIFLTKPEYVMHNLLLAEINLALARWPGEEEAAGCLTRFVHNPGRELRPGGI